jgi:hypothetical protein
MNKPWVNIDISAYDLPEDINEGDWRYLFNDLKEAYAVYYGWDDDDFWYEDDDKLYQAECAVYEVISELREGGCHE